MHRLHSSAAAAMHDMSLVSVVATAGLGAQARSGEIGEIAFALTSASWMRAASTPWCRAAAMARPSRVRSALAIAASSSFFASFAYGVEGCVQGGGPDDSTPGKWAGQGQTRGQGGNAAGWGEEYGEIGGDRGLDGGRSRDTVARAGGWGWG